MRSKPVSLPLWAISSVIGVFLFAGALTVEMARAEAPLLGLKSSDALLEADFVGALKAINDLRKTNHLTTVECNDFFAEFGKYGEAARYKAFFESIGVRTLISEANHEHLVAFEIDQAWLRSRQLMNFFRNDRIVIVFKRDTASSDTVVLFHAVLLDDCCL